MINNLPEIFRNIPALVYPRDIFDVLIVSVLVYMIVVFIRQTRSFFLISGFSILFSIWILSRIFNFSLTREIFQYFVASFILIFAVVFQREIRKFFEWFSIAGKNLAGDKILVSSKISSIIIDAAKNLAAKKIGALIVLPGRFRLDNFLEGGLVLNGQISLPLLLSIFDPSSPGHDGAVIIEGETIKRFGAHLPLAEDFRKYGNLGTRHRAALGLAEKTDAYVIVVSEERGIITLAHNGKLEEIDDIGKLEKIIAGLTKEKVPGESHPWRFVIFRNFEEKIFSFVIAAILWAFFVLLPRI